VEPWTTARIGRENFYSAIDNRLEFEFGLTERLQTSLYINTSSSSQDVLVQDPTNPKLFTKVRQREFELQGISSEWKLKLSDPVADAIGSAAYLELTYGTGEAEVEGKLIFDRRINNLVLAANLVGEMEWEFETPGQTDEELKLEADIGAAYFVAPNVTVGLEARPTTIIEEGEVTSVALFAGPTVSTAYERWWAALTVLPQVYSPKNKTGGAFDLHDHERVEARILLGMHL
jgi:hypothetical protein